MVLLVLAVVWVVALTPMVLRKLSERRVVTSVTTFNRRLGHLRSHAARLQPVPVALAPIGFSAAAQRLHEGDGRSDAGVLAMPLPPEREVAPLVTSRTTTYRRRRVIVCLLGGTLFCFVVGLVPALGFLFDLALVGLAFTVAYLALLVHFHRRAVERAQKVVALETRRHVVSALDRARVTGGVLPSRGRVHSGPTGMGWSITGAHPGRATAGVGGFEPRALVGSRG